MSYVSKLYEKKQEIITEYLKFRTEYERFKLNHKVSQSIYSFNTKYFCADKLKELELKLSKNKISVQKIRKVFVKLKKKSNNYDYIEKIIIENFIKNYDNVKSHFQYQKDIKDEWCERRNDERNKKSLNASITKEHKAQYLIPFIFNFTKTYLKQNNLVKNSEISDDFVAKLFETKYVEPILQKFKDEYGDTNEAYNYFKSI